MGIAKALGVEKVEDIFIQTENLNKKAALAKKTGKVATKAKLATTVKAKAKKTVAKGAKKALKEGAKAKAAALAKKTKKKKALEVDEDDKNIAVTVAKKVKSKGRGVKKKKEGKDTKKLAAARNKSQDKDKGKDKDKDKDKELEIALGNAPFFGQPGADSPDFKPKIYLSLEAIGYVSSLDQVDAAQKAMQAPQLSTPDSPQESSQKKDEQQKAPTPPPPPAPIEQVTTQAVEVALEKVRDEKKTEGHHFNPQAMFSSMRQSSGPQAGSDVAPPPTPKEAQARADAERAARAAESGPSMNELIRRHTVDKK